MKKLGFFLVSLLALCLTASVFVSCGDDDDNNPLVGVWWQNHDGDYYHDFTFRGNHTGSMHEQDGVGTGGDYEFSYSITEQSGEGGNVSGRVHLDISGRGTYDWGFRVENGKYLYLNGMELFKQ